MSGRPRLLMAVFNAIDYDGRVQRSAQSLATEFDVMVLCVRSGGRYSHATFEIETVELAGRSKYRDHLRFGRALAAAARRLRPAVVFAHDYFMAVPAWIAARLTGARFVYDAHELIIPVPGERLAPRERVWYQLERSVVGRADLVIAANQERAELMHSHYRLDAVPLVVRNIAAPPAALLDDAAVYQRYPELRRRSATERLVIYQGDMSFTRGIDIYLDVTRQLPPDMRLVLVGTGPDHVRLTERIEQMGLRSRVTQLGRVPRDHLYDIMRLCDIGLIAYPMEGLNFFYCAPNKLYEYAQAGIPVVTTSQPPLRTALEAYGIGEVVAQAGTPVARATAWSDAITRVCLNIDLHRKRLPAFLSDHHWAHDQDRLRQSIADIVPHDAAPVISANETPVSV